MVKRGGGVVLLKELRGKNGSRTVDDLTKKWGGMSPGLVGVGGKLCRKKRGGQGKNALAVMSGHTKIGIIRVKGGTPRELGKRDMAKGNHWGSAPQDETTALGEKSERECT